MEDTSKYAIKNTIQKKSLHLKIYLLIGSAAFYSVSFSTLPTFNGRTIQYITETTVFNKGLGM